jgi:hypothetical protein
MSTGTPVASTSTQATTSFGSQVIFAIVFTFVGMAALIGIALMMSEADQSGKRVAFENVLQMSSEELEGKSVSDLTEYRQAIRDVSHYSLVIGNVSGYDKEILDRELGQVESLILKKTAS